MKRVEKNIQNPFEWL